MQFLMYSVSYFWGYKKSLSPLFDYMHHIPGLLLLLILHSIMQKANQLNHHVLCKCDVQKYRDFVSYIELGSSHVTIQPHPLYRIFHTSLITALTYTYIFTVGD